LIALIAFVAIGCVACGSLGAEERAKRFDSGLGLGFETGQGGNASFALMFGGDYYLTDLIAINPTFWLFAGDFTNFAILPRVKFNFDIPGVDHLEAFASGGVGVLVGDVDATYIIAFGGGGYYWLLDGHLGLGTDMNFTINGTTGAHFRFVWAVASALYRF
jgi:hypothetical protein